MPQMSPLLWVNLYWFFTLIFISFIIMNFYIKPSLPIQHKLAQTKKTELNWKW